jgi:hypothetical protein
VAFGFEAAADLVDLLALADAQSLRQLVVVEGDAATSQLVQDSGRHGHTT